MHTSAMSDRGAAQTQQTADVGRRLEMHAHEMTSRMTFALAKKGGAAVGPTRPGKGTKIMALVDRHGLPVAVHVASASPYEPVMFHHSTEPLRLPAHRS